MAITKLRQEETGLLRKGSMVIDLTPIISGSVIVKTADLASNLRIDNWCNSTEAKILILGTIAVISVIACKHRAIAGFLRGTPAERPSSEPI